MSDAGVLELRGERVPRTPVVVLAYAGWNDGGEAATSAVAHLLESSQTEKLATLDTEEFLDFTVVRPHVRLRDDGAREIRWPDHEFFSIRSPARDFDLVVGLGVEPSLRWRTYTRTLVDFLESLAPRLVILLGAFLDEVIYSQPIQIMAGSADPELAARLSAEPSHYEGPTGIIGVLAEALATRGVRAASLWARLPHYVSATPNPRAALALLQRVEALSSFPLDKRALEQQATAFDQQVSEAIAADPQLSAYVRELKKRAFSQ